MINLKTTIDQIRALKRYIFSFNKFESIKDDPSNFNLFDKAVAYIDGLQDQVKDNLEDLLDKTKKEFAETLKKYYTKNEADDLFLTKELGNSYLKFSNPKMNEILEINSGDAPALEFTSKSDHYLKIKDIEIKGNLFKIFKNGVPIFEINNSGFANKKKTLVTSKNASEYISMAGWNYARVSNDNYIDIPYDVHEIYAIGKNSNQNHSVFVYIKNSLSEKQMDTRTDGDLPNPNNGWTPGVSTDYIRYGGHQHHNDAMIFNIIKPSTKYRDTWIEKDVPSTYVLKPGERYAQEKRRTHKRWWNHDYWVERRDWIQHVEPYQDPGKYRIRFWYYAHWRTNKRWWNYDYDDYHITNHEYDLYWR